MHFEVIDLPSVIESETSITRARSAGSIDHKAMPGADSRSKEKDSVPIDQVSTSRIQNLHTLTEKARFAVETKLMKETRGFHGKTCYQAQRDS